MINPKMMQKTLNVEFRAIQSRRAGEAKGAMICRELKSGKLGKPFFVQFIGAEKNAQDVIARMESNNPGNKYFEA